MCAYRFPMIASVLAAAFCPASGPAQETRSPLPYIAAPSNAASSPASAEPAVVEQPPARLRSGPPRIACWACPSNSKGYAGHYIGGGNAFAICRSQPRTVMEGTWGWDYRGRCLPQCVFLQWWHGRCYQGGAGAYRVDGPNLLKWLAEKHREGTGPP